MLFDPLSNKNGFPLVNLIICNDATTDPDQFIDKAILNSLSANGVSRAHRFSTSLLLRFPLKQMCYLTPPNGSHSLRLRDQGGFLAYPPALPCTEIQ